MEHVSLSGSLWPPLKKEMILQDSEKLPIITDPNEIPRIETECCYVAVRAVYLDRLWELRVNIESNTAVLSLVSDYGRPNRESINVVHHVHEGLPPIDVVGIAGLATHIKTLISKFSLKTFILEGDAKNAE